MVFALCLMLGNQVSSPRCSDTMTMKPDVTVEWHGQVKHNNMKNHQVLQSLIFSWVFGLTLDKFPWGSAVGATMRLYHKGLSAWRVEVGVKYTAEQSVDETDETGYNNNLLCIGCRTWQWTRKGDREASFYQIMGPSFEYRTKKWSIRISACLLHQTGVSGVFACSYDPLSKSRVNPGFPSRP